MAAPKRKPTGGIGTPLTGKPKRIGGPPGYLSPPRRPAPDHTGGRPGDEFSRKYVKPPKPANRLSTNKVR